jgi:hypothetical protein
VGVSAEKGNTTIAVRENLLQNISQEREGAGGKEREMTQTLYAHMNKRNKKKRGKVNTPPQKRKHFPM